MQPLWAQMDALMTVLTIPRLGVERADRQYQLQTLHRTGAALAFGSDWPVSSGAPLDGIAVAVSRRTAEGEPRVAGPRTRSCPSSSPCPPIPARSRIRPSPRASGAASRPGRAPIWSGSTGIAEHTAAGAAGRGNPRNLHLRGAQAYRNDDRRVRP